MKQFALNDDVEDSNPADSMSNSSYFESEKSDRDSENSKRKQKRRTLNLASMRRQLTGLSILSDGFKLTCNSNLLVSK